MTLFVLKVALVITDGKQTRDRDPITPLMEASQGMKDKGITVYALGVGKNVDRTELQKIASSEETLFTAESFKALGIVAQKIKDSLCKGMKNIVVY